MTQSDLQLVPPSYELLPSFLEMVAEFHATGETDWPHGGMAEERRYIPEDNLALTDFNRYLVHVADLEQGRDLPQGYVSCSTYWLVQETRVLGTGSFRHELNDRLRMEGGQIGYCIRPSERKKGLATSMLRMLLARAAERGLDGVLVFCRTENVISARVIEKCGGVLQDEQVSSRSGLKFKRYWITLSNV